MMKLRAYVSLWHLWQAVGNTGRLTKTRHSLHSLYVWFIEGFSVVDLQEAKALLNQLASNEPG